MKSLTITLRVWQSFDGQLEIQIPEIAWLVSFFLHSDRHWPDIITGRTMQLIYGCVLPRADHNRGVDRVRQSSIVQPLWCRSRSHALGRSTSIFEDTGDPLLSTGVSVFRECRRHFSPRITTGYLTWTPHMPGSILKRCLHILHYVTALYSSYSIYTHIYIIATLNTVPAQIHWTYDTLIWRDLRTSCFSAGTT